MNVSFAQVYIEFGIEYPFSWQFQYRISESISALVVPSRKYAEKYGSDFQFGFYMGAKTKIRENEIHGPSVSKRYRTVDYTIFLPFDVIAQSEDTPRAALGFLIQGVCTVLESLEIDTSNIKREQETLIEEICSDPTMFDNSKNWYEEDQ